MCVVTGQVCYASWCKIMFGRGNKAGRDFISWPRVWSRLDMNHTMHSTPTERPKHEEEYLQSEQGCSFVFSCGGLSPRPPQLESKEKKTAAAEPS